MTVECELLAVPVLLAFDSVGLKGEVGPYVSLTANACVNYSKPANDVDAGFNLYEQHGLAGEFKGRVQVPFLGAGKDFDLISVRALKSDEKYLVGNASTCEIKLVDSCKGRPDGFFCSVQDPYSGIVCEGGQIASGLQCAETQKCVGGTPTSIDCE